MFCTFFKAIRPNIKIKINFSHQPHWHFLLTIKPFYAYFGLVRGMSVPRILMKPPHKALVVYLLSHSVVVGCGLQLHTKIVHADRWFYVYAHNLSTQRISFMATYTYFPTSALLL